MAQQTYCGNNLNFTGLINGTHALGTNYQCLRKGIGVGRNLPYDESYSQPYNPVDDRKFYCGNNPILPDGYYAIGSPSKCLAIGVGLGKQQRYMLGSPSRIKTLLPYLIFLFLCISIFLIFYYTKPYVITKIDNNEHKIDWNKFIPFYISICLFIGVIIWLIWSTFINF